MFRLLLYFILKEDAIRNENVVVYNTKIKNNSFTSLASCLGASCWGLLAALEASALLCCFCTFLENNARIRRATRAVQGWVGYLYAVKQGSEQNSLLLPGIGSTYFKVCFASWKRSSSLLFHDTVKLPGIACMLRWQRRWEHCPHSYWDESISFFNFRWITSSCLVTLVHPLSFIFWKLHFRWSLCNVWRQTCLPSLNRL